jgi:hypothetical protein
MQRAWGKRVVRGGEHVIELARIFAADVRKRRGGKP